MCSIELYKRCANLINLSNNICVLTGAGISTNTGIPDFRSKNGWYSKSPEDILSFSNFMKNPKEVYEFLYKYYKMIDVEPTLTHKLVSDLENRGKNVSVITQNIDKLHQRAGSSDVIEYHGGLDKAYCVLCSKEYPIENVLNDNIGNDNFNYKCDCGGYIKPNITLFGEDILEHSFAKKELSRADLVIVIGTSLQVYPFNELPRSCPVGTPIIVINKGFTSLDGKASIVLNTDCDKALGKIFDNL